MFERVDADNGTIEYPEFLAACAELEVKDVDDDILRDIYAEADVDGRGSVDSPILPRLARAFTP